MWAIAIGMNLLAVGMNLGARCVTPIGPFCPFRSKVTAYDSSAMSDMAALSQKKMPRFATEMARLELTMANGGEPDLDAVRSMASDLAEAEREWRTMLDRMRLTNDFQSREYYQMTAAWSERQGESLETVGLMMRWQADCMEAFADGRPPLPPPPGIDLEKLARQKQQQMEAGGAGGGGAGSLIAQVSAASSINSSPFTGEEAAFSSPVVKEEYQALCRDHASTITLGSDYGSFDALGKLAYLDALEAIEARWDTFFARFDLLKCLNDEFKEQSERYLGSMGMSTQTFREVLGAAHDLMRAAAEEERQLGR
jgi:hypothetical protein